MPEYLSPGVYVEEQPAGIAPIAGVGTSTAGFIGVLAASTTPAGLARLCTNFSEFKAAFGDFNDDPGHFLLASAVYGFFNNGGTRCYVARVDGTLATADIQPALDAFEAIDEIAIVTAPGLTSKAQCDALASHCKLEGLLDRVAILDCPSYEGKTFQEISADLTFDDAGKLPSPSDYAACYFPWIQVKDPRKAGATAFVPPSGHIAGIYARVDA